MSEVPTQGRLDRSRSSELAALVALLANQVRRRILVALAGGPKDRQTLANELGLSSSAVGRHLRRLGEHDLVTAKRVGRCLSHRLSRRATAIVGRHKAILNLSAPDGSQVTLVTRVSPGIGRVHILTPSETSPHGDSSG